MVDFTSRIKLPMLDAAGNEAQRDYPALQRQFAELVDENAGAKEVTSTTRPNSPFPGQFIFEFDTKKIVAWNGTAWVTVFELVPPVLERKVGIHATRDAFTPANNAWSQVLLNTFQTRLPSGIASFGTSANAGRVQWGRNCPVLVSAFASFPAVTTGNRRALRITRNGVHLSQFGEVLAAPFTEAWPVGLSMGAYLFSATDGDYFGVEVHNGGGSGALGMVGLTIAAVGDPFS